jgi:hypothetical protein
MKTAGRFLTALAVTLVVGSAGAAQAGDRHADRRRPVTLYEVTEQAQFTPDGQFRVATASIQGTAERGSPICPAGLLEYARAAFQLVGIHVRAMDRCVVVVVASDRVSLITGAGEFQGDVAVVVNANETNPADGAELVVMTGWLEGTMQVARPDGLLIDIVSGEFTAQAVLDGFPLPPPAPFTGTFRLPTGHRWRAVYLDDRGRPVPVRPREFSLGDATVRVEVTFD